MIKFDFLKKFLYNNNIKKEAYFGNNKQLNAAIAAKHTEEMKSKYAFEIGCSVVNTKIYGDKLYENIQKKNR